MKYKVLVHLPFNIFGPDDFRYKLDDHDWVKKRCDVFEHYTIKSLDNQDYPYLACVPFHHTCPPSAQPLLDLCDKYDYEHFIEESDKETPVGISASWVESNLDRLSDPFYLQVLSSDDMIPANLFRFIEQISPDAGTGIIFRHGFLYDINANRLAWHLHPSPPILGMVISKQAVASVGLINFLEEYQLNRTHPSFKRCRQPLHIEHLPYCMTISETNATTYWNHRHTKPVVGDEITDEKKKSDFLNIFGV